MESQTSLLRSDSVDSLMFDVVIVQQKPLGSPGGFCFANFVYTLCKYTYLHYYKEEK